MTLVAVNAETTAVAGLVRLRATLDDLPPAVPVTVMLHGYKYRPGRPGRCPHSDLLSPVAGDGAPSWPRHLGVGPDHLGIAFGWDAAGSLWRAWAEAERAGLALARTLETLARQGRRANIVAHSLGARVALAALAQSPPGALRRLILIAPAEFRSTAQAAMGSPAGQAAEVVSVLSRENDLFDALVEWLVAPHRRGARSLGEGLGRGLPNWVDLPMDEDRTRAALAALGHPIAPPARRICHWSGYLRPGLFPLYRAILAGNLPLAALRAAAEGPRAPRWSRLLALPELHLPLPLRRDAPL